MRREMIKGAEYNVAGKRMTYTGPTGYHGRGMFVEPSGKTHNLHLCDAIPVDNPTTFPEPERWHRNAEDDDRVIDDHNAEVDRLMREIRRLEALVNKK